MAKYCINFSGGGGNTLSRSVCAVWHEWCGTNLNVSWGVEACRKATTLKT